ncbi:hypothetical protein J7M07_00600 [bacterium]|nr:hypothetical protein [bacterium]
MTRILLAVVLMMLIGVGCLEDRPESVSDVGTVVFLSFEGGFFGIVDAHERRWDPSNLSDEFQVDSLRVHFQGIVTDRPSFHMWGRTIELTAVRRLK